MLRPYQRIIHFITRICMSIAIIRTRALCALNAPAVTVEVHLSNGLPAFNLVGLPETAVRESKDRVRSAILNSRFEFPAKRITINLAPADLPKDGGRFDLAIALGILAASGQIPLNLIEKYEFIGELALTGEIRPVRGVLNSALACAEDNRLLIVPAANGAEAALAVCDEHRIATHLLDVCAHLSGAGALPAAKAQLPKHAIANTVDMADIKGQHQAKRALEIAAAGGHNLLYEGPPGCGKSMLAQRLPSILPAMEKTEALSQLAIRSIMNNQLDLSQWQQRPFRAPHHSASAVALVGGGNPPKPGEVSLAHNGVLFLDELPEFQRPVLEALREPLENGHICISRAAQQALFPANFQLIAAMNPCPCGYYGDSSKHCRCSVEHIQRYRQKISGPLLDRIDLHLRLQPTPLNALSDKICAAEESSASIQQRVEATRQRQYLRQGKSNAALTGSELQEYAQLSPAALSTLHRLAEKLAMSARAFQRAIKVARTIADLANSEEINENHILEACSYRQAQMMV
jgi:magnesium chelatase family protein